VKPPAPKTKKSKTPKSAVKVKTATKAAAKTSTKISADKKSKAADKDDGIFGVDDDSQAADPYSSDELSSEDLLTLDSFAEEE